MADPAAFCGQTRKSFEGVITKPPLTDKLLSKPPFRFIHDIVSSVISNTGYMKDVFTPDELDSSHIKDKESKIAFLQKIIASVESTTGQKIDVKPGKIVAGHDPDKTNVFLQKIALAAKGGDMNMSGGSAGSNKENSRTPKKESSGDNLKASKSKSDKDKDKDKHKSHKKSSSKERSESKDKTDVKKDSSTKKSSSKERSSSKDKTVPSKDKDKDSSLKKSSKSKTSSEVKKDDKSPTKSPSKTKKTSKDGKESHSKTSKTSKTKSSSKSLTVKDDSISREGTDNSLVPNGTVPKDNTANVFDSFDTNKLTPRSPRKEKSGESLLSSQNSPSQSFNMTAQNKQKEEEIARPSSTARASRGAARPGSSLGRPGSVLGGRPGTAMARPGTAMARAAPPKLKRKELGEIEQPKTIESNEVMATSNIIGGEIDETQNNEDDDAFVMEDTTIVHGHQDLGDDMVDADQLDAAEHGGLVRKILETKKELETGLEDESRRDVGVSVFDEKERERTIKEARKLQEQVQNMTRTAHPLGRLIDFLQEDIDSMVKELEQWRSEAKTNMTQLRQAHGGDNELDPLKEKLHELDSKIGEKRDAIANVKASILANNKKIKGQI